MQAHFDDLYVILRLCNIYNLLQALKSDYYNLSILGIEIKIKIAKIKTEMQMLP